MDVGWADGHRTSERTDAQEWIDGHRLGRRVPDERMGAQEEWMDGGRMSVQPELVYMNSCIGTPYEL